MDRAYGVLGAGDQGLMFGSACDETPELTPAAIMYAHRLVRRQAELRKSGNLARLQPDAKSHVTLRYRDGHPVGIESVVLSTQHDEGIELDELRAAVSEHIIAPIILEALRTLAYREHINPTGKFVIGGPTGDTGLTGRKIIVDTYGGAAPHGGGADRVRDSKPYWTVRRKPGKTRIRLLPRNEMTHSSRYWRFDLTGHWRGGDVRATHQANSKTRALESQRGTEEIGQTPIARLSAEGVRSVGRRALKFRDLGHR